MKIKDIVLVTFPFSDLTSSKKRPALVLSICPYSPKHSLYTIAMITSKIEVPRLKGDILLSQWEKSGLLHPSLLRLGKIASIEGELISKKLGTLQSSDFSAVKKEFAKNFSQWLE